MAKKSALIGRTVYVKDHIAWYTGRCGVIVDVDEFGGYWIDTDRDGHPYCLNRWEFVVPRKKED